MGTTSVPSSHVWPSARDRKAADVRWLGRLMSGDASSRPCGGLDPDGVKASSSGVRESSAWEAKVS